MFSYRNTYKTRTLTFYEGLAADPATFSRVVFLDWVRQLLKLPWPPGAGSHAEIQLMIFGESSGGDEIATAEWWSGPNQWSNVWADVEQPSWQRASNIIAYWYAIDLPWKIGHFLSDVSDHFDKMPIDHTVSNDLHIGAGLEHMPAAIHIMDMSARAGRQHPPMVLRNAAGEMAQLWTEGHTSELLGTVATRTNVIESAKNALRVKYAALAKPLDFEELTELPTDEEITEGLAIRDKVLAAFAPAAIVAEFNAKMTELSDPDALPADLATVKGVLTGRVEAAAMKRVQEIKGAKTQQGVDLPASCTDQAGALERVTQECDMGRTAIADAATIEAAKTAFAAAVAAIKAVTPIHVPVWASDESTITGHVVTVRASHPSGQTILGRVMLTLWGAVDGNGDPLFLSPTVTRPGGGAAVVWQATIPSGTVYPVEAHFGARNLCGPSGFDLTIEDPTA